MKKSMNNKLTLQIQRQETPGRIITCVRMVGVAVACLAMVNSGYIQAGGNVPCDSDVKLGTVCLAARNAYVPCNPCPNGISGFDPSDEYHNAKCVAGTAMYDCQTINVDIPVTFYEVSHDIDEVCTVTAYPMTPGNCDALYNVDYDCLPPITNG